MTHNELSGVIFDTALHIHQKLGPGLLESVYEAVMAIELRKQGLQVETQVPLAVSWDGISLEAGFRIDLVVQDLVIVELKSVEAVTALHKKQLLTYLRLSNKQLGLLINYNVNLLKDGITRVVNGLNE